MTLISFSRSHRHFETQILIEKSLFAHCLLNQWLKFDQTSTHKFERGKEVIRIWWPWAHFQGHYIIKWALCAMSGEYLISIAYCLFSFKLHRVLKIFTLPESLLVFSWPRVDKKLFKNKKFLAVFYGSSVLLSDFGFIFPLIFMLMLQMGSLILNRIMLQGHAVKYLSPIMRKPVFGFATR